MSYNGQHWNFTQIRAQPQGTSQPLHCQLWPLNTAHTLWDTQVLSRVSHHLRHLMLVCNQLYRPFPPPRHDNLSGHYSPQHLKTQELRLELIYQQPQQNNHSFNNSHPATINLGSAMGRVLLKGPKIQQWQKQTNVPAFMELKF